MGIPDKQSVSWFFTDMLRKRLFGPAGSAYRFRVDLYGQSYWSGSENTCVLPDCTAQTVTIQAPQGQPAEQEIAYSYDALSRLVAADYDSGVYFHYGYDAAGNRLEAAEKLAAEVDEVVNTYTYDAANRQTGANGVAYTWDANGNLLNDGQYTYHYDSANRLSAVEQETYSESYAYNGLGDRVSQTANGVTTQYTLDLNSGLTQVLTENTPGEYGDETYLYGLARLAQVSAESTEYFVADALGSARQLTDAGADVTLQRSYTPYGEILRASGTGKTNYAFTGESFDPQTGLTYLRARYYSAGQGRFISQDTWAGDAKQPLSYNRWAYGYDNPVRYIDPSGLKAIISWLNYQMRLDQLGYNVDIVDGNRNIGINQKALGRESLLMIIRNFERDPSDTEIHCYNGNGWLTMFIKGEGQVSVSPNRYDWLFAGWASYWNWRAKLSGIPITYNLTPDFLKAVAYGESTMGTRTKTPGTQHLMNLILNDIGRLKNVQGDTDAQGFPDNWKRTVWLKTAAIQGMANYYGNPNDLKNLYNFDLNKLVPWGFIDIGWGDLNNHAIEVGGYGRLAYALALSKYNGRPSEDSTYRKDEYIDKVLHGMNSEDATAEDIERLRNNVRNLAQNGIWKGTRLWVPSESKKGM
jgi:RHS repeat-associated protein